MIKMGKKIKVKWQENLLKSSLEHCIIYSDQGDHTDPVTRRSLPLDQERTMCFNVLYKIEIFRRPDKSIDAFLSSRLPDVDSWSLMAGKVDCGRKGLIVNYIKRIPYVVGDYPARIASFLGLYSVSFFDCIAEFEREDFVDADLVAILTFGGHCDTGIALKTYAEHLHDGGVGYLFG